MKFFDKPQPLTKGKFEVYATKNYVHFTIDHQGFNLRVEHDDDALSAEKLKRNRWYARQLRAALKRLAEFGNQKTDGRQSRNTKKPKARNAKQPRQNVRTRPR